MYDILDHQKLVEGKVTIKYSPVNFSELLNDIHASYQFDAINKGIQFKLVMDKVLQTTKFHSDPLRFTQIITNLVVNSLKYTHKGAILLEGNTKDNMLQIIVKDTGIGILPNDLQKIKNRFYQVNEDNGVSKGSYGLGLSIVKQLVDLFNGRLEVTSKIDLGSSFKVSLPLIPAKETMNTIQSVSAVKLPSLNEKYTIIHLEDDEPAKQMVSEILNDKHFHLIQTSGIEQTMARMAENSFDLIISDLMIDSQVIEQSLIDIQVKITPIPLIVLSAFEKDKMENISPYYIQKPYTIDELLDLVFTLLGKNEYDEPKLEKAYQQYDHDATKILKFLDILIKEFNNYIDRVEKAYKEKSADQWSAIMHKLITHIKSMELTGLHQLMPVNVENLTAGGYEKVINSLRYLVCFFRTQRKLIAAD